MAQRSIRRALIAVYDKTGIVEFARALVEEFGIEIISTGGTAKHLSDAGIPVTLVETITGFPEMLDGRVKTLHPKIHAAILADRDNPEHMRQLAEHGIEPIDMVVVNLYPFEKTVADPNCTPEQAIEMIDIGGPCLLRAAAKNHRHVWILNTSSLYQQVLECLRHASDELQSRKRASLARYSFSRTWRYDRLITAYLERIGYPDAVECLGISLSLPTVDEVYRIHYGENPHQVAELRQSRVERQSHFIERPVIALPDHAHELSFNNFVDADAALALCAELSRSLPNNEPRPSGRGSSIEGRASKNVAVFIKHTNACGVGVADDPVEAYRRAYLGDVNAAMGGILAVNFVVTAEFAEAVMHSLDRWGKTAGAGGFFIEVWVAPSFDDDAVDVIRRAKKWGEKVRMLPVGVMSATPCSGQVEYKSISGGMLVQTSDFLGLNEDQWKVVTKRQPTETELANLRLAWFVAKHTKSNAISICKDSMLIGNGAGQMSRVMSCRIATWLAKENGHADKLSGAVAASDAFFPFRDGPDILLDAGVPAIIQPGGSKRDEETIRACDERGATMIFTGTRHFRH